MALSKNQLEYIPDDLVSLYQELEKWSINDICRRVAKTNTWTETSELMVEALREQGYSPIEIQQRVLSRLQASPEYKEELAINTYEHKAELKQKVADLNADRTDLVKSAMEEVHATGMRYDMSMWDQAGKTLTESSAINQVTKAMIKNADKDLKNLTKSLGFKTSSGWTSEAEAYQKQLNLALMKVSSGTCSYQTAVDDVVKELSKSGLRTIDYASGISRQLDTAVRNSILTASARLTGEISMQNALSSGEDLVEVSHHAGARTDESGGPGDHACWQGKVYSISGNNHAKESARLGYPIKSLEKVTGYPSDATGLMGYCCGHNFFIFFEGISEPAVKEPEPEPKSHMGKSYTLYEANQKQRQLERDIRATKRRISATKAVNGDNSVNLARLSSMEKEYKNFSEAMEIRAKTNRLKVAEPVTGRRVKSVVKSSESGIIKSGAVSGARNPFSKEADEHATRYYGLVRSMTTDVSKIAKATNKSEQQIQKVKDYIFNEKHDLGNGKEEFFEPDYMMAESWRRLQRGKPELHDVTLINHEVMERKLVESGYAQEEAHKITSEKYNYQKEASEFYDKIEKSKKRE